MRVGLSRYSLRFFTLLALQFLLLPQANAAEHQPTLEVSPQEIRIKSFYHGTKLTLKGTVPEHSQVALMLYGEGKQSILNRKGRIGPFWMNVETVNIDGAPEMYYVLTSTASFADLAPVEGLLAFGIGYDALRTTVTIDQEGSDPDSTFQEFTELKEEMGLYGMLPGAIALKPHGNGSARFTASVSLPASVPPGEYEVSMYCFSDGRSVCSLSKTLTAKRIGLTRQVSLLASNHAALYGTFAIVVAMAAGLLMGFLFGSKAKGGH